MMSASIKNFTPFPNLRFSNLDNRGREFGVLVVKVAWDISSDGTCTLSEEQEPLVLTDEHRGEPGLSSVRYPSDGAPYKPRTDVILDAVAFSPGGVERDEWPIGLRLREAHTDRLLIDKRLRATGPSEWEHRERHRITTATRPVTSVEVVWENAYGGLRRIGRDDEGKDIVEAFEPNPVGRGFARPSDEDRVVTLSRPQVLPGEAGPDGRDTIPVGFGPLAPSWMPRRPLGGTYDQDWQDNVWPAWPVDYDFAFHNAAPEDQQVEMDPEAALEFELTGLHPSRDVWTIALPPFPAGLLMLEDGLVYACSMRPDTVFLDIGAFAQGDHRAFVTARIPYRIGTVEAITILPIEDASQGAARLLAPPAPVDVVAEGTWPPIDVGELREIARTLP